MGKRGPQSKYCKEVADMICSHLSEGGTLKEAAAMIGVSDMQIRNWRKAHPDFEERVADARLAGIWPNLEEAMTLLRKAIETGKKDHAIIADKFVKHVEWRAEKLLSTFQPVSKQEVKHENAQQVVIGWAAPSAENSTDETVAPRTRISEKAEQNQGLTH